MRFSSLTTIAIVALAAINISQTYKIKQLQYSAQENDLRWEAIVAVNKIQLHTTEMEADTFKNTIDDIHFLYELVLTRDPNHLTKTERNLIHQVVAKDNKNTGRKLAFLNAYPAKEDEVE